MKKIWKALEIGLWVIVFCGLAYGMLSPQINVARQDKIIQKLQQEIENLTQKTQKNTHQKYGHSIKVSV